MLPGDAWGLNSHRTAAVRWEMLQVAGHQRSRAYSDGNLQEYRVMSSTSGGARCGHGSEVTCFWNCRIAKKASCQACDIPNRGRAKTSRYSNSMRSSNASRNRRAKSASTRRPGGPKGERSPETRTLVSSTQTGASAMPRSLLPCPPCGFDLPLYVCGRDDLRTTLLSPCPHRAYRPAGTSKQTVEPFGFHRHTLGALATPLAQ